MRLFTFLIHILLPLSCMFTASHGFISSKPSSYQSRVNRHELRRNNGHYVKTMLKETVKSEESKSDKVVAEEEMSETQKMMAQVKEAGLAGIISYALWELGFWTVSVPVCVFGYYEVTGHLPDLSNAEDQGKLGAEAFAFVNFARFAVPLRIGLALSTTPWIDENIVRRFLMKDAAEEE